MLLFVLLNSKLDAQVSNNESGLENIFESVSNDTFNSQEIELIEYYRLFPIDLINDSVEEIAKLPLISITDAYRIKDYFNKLDTNELTKPFCGSFEAYMNLSPSQELILRECTRANFNNYKIKHLNFRMRNTQNLQITQAEKENKYLGSQLDLYSKLNVKYDNFSLNFLTNKDAGEEHLADFYSGNITFKTNDFSFAMGDFSYSAGMGNLLWNSFGFRKGSDILAPNKIEGKSFSPYQSTIDYQFFRGAAGRYSTTLIESKLNINTFFSSIYRSATSDSDEVSSIYTMGYYRTDNEISKKDKLLERSFCFNPELNNKDMKLGIILLYLNYNKPINSESSRFFSGKDGLLSSLYFKFNTDNYSISSELSLDANQNFANKTNFTYKFKTLSYTTLFRYYNKEFRSPYGYNFGENSYLSNEIGLYNGIKINLKSNDKIGMYLDYYQTLTRTYLIPAKVRGIDIWADYIHSLTYNYNIYLRFRNEIKTDSKTNTVLNERIIYDKIKYSFRAEYSRYLDFNLILRLRCEAAYLDYNSFFPNESGVSGFIEFKWDISDRVSAGGRYSLYSTDSYESAIWQFEYSFPGLMTTNANYGDGSRIFIYANLLLADNINLRARYSNTRKNNVNQLGSGDNLINGNSLSSFICQLDIGF